MRFLAGLLVFSFSGIAADSPAPAEGDYTIRNFKFQSGETIPELRLHYYTLGKPSAANAVLIMHGTGGTGHGFSSPGFGGELFNEGQPIDASKYFVIMPDAIGHGKSSKPSDGMRAHFPHYGYEDIVVAQHRLVTEKLGVNHLRLVLGLSMGAMHTWLWGERYPEMMDGLFPIGSLP